MVGDYGSRSCAGRILCVSAEYACEVSGQGLSQASGCTSLGCWRWLCCLQRVGQQRIESVLGLGRMAGLWAELFCRIRCKMMGLKQALLLRTPPQWRPQVAVHHRRLCHQCWRPARRLRTVGLRCQTGLPTQPNPVWTFTGWPALGPDGRRPRCGAPPCMRAPGA